MLAGTNAARRSLNARARALLKANGVIAGEPLVVGRREFMVGDEVVARRNDRRFHDPGGAGFVKNGSTGTVTHVDAASGELVVAFAREGTVPLPHDYLAAGHLEHAYARTTYGVQGATLDRARYHPSDVSRFEEGYVAITRAREQTNLYVVEGDLDTDDDDVGHHATEATQSGMEVIADALARRADKRLATETDPLVLESTRLAKEYSLQQLHRRRRGVEVILKRQPPSVSRELAEAQRTADLLRARRAAAEERRASWKPGQRRAAAREMASLDQAIAGCEHRITDLQGAQARHEAFAIDHAPQFAEREVLRRAELARRLQVRIAAVAEPPSSITAIVGAEPSSQRHRLRWQRAVEAIAVYLDEQGVQPPEHPLSASELLGSAPSGIFEGYGRDTVTSSMRDGHSPELEVGLEISWP